MTKLDLSNIKNKKILITGGAGFIGSNLVRFFAERKIMVHVVDNLSTGRISNIEPYLNYVSFKDENICNFYSMYRIFENIRPDVVFHMAAIPGVSSSVDKPIYSNNVNISGFLNVLKISQEKNVKRFVFSSSSSIYGGARVLPTPEYYIGTPKSPYALQKITCEKYCKLFSDLYGIDTVSLRYFNVFGPNQQLNGEHSAVIASFCNSVKESKRPTIYGDGSQYRDFCYVDNVVQANILTGFYNGRLNGSSFNVGTGKTKSIKSLCESLNTLEPIHLKERPGDVYCSQADISRISSLGYEPTVDFETGIERTLKYYLEK